MIHGIIRIPIIHGIALGTAHGVDGMPDGTLDGDGLPGLGAGVADGMTRGITEVVATGTTAGRITGTITGTAGHRAAVRRATMQTGVIRHLQEDILLKEVHRAAVHRAATMLPVLLRREAAHVLPLDRAIVHVHLQEEPKEYVLPHLQEEIRASLQDRVPEPA